MKKILALLLCAAMLLSVFALVSCGEVEKQTEKNTDESTTEADTASGDSEKAKKDENGDYLDIIPDGKYDFGGRDFIITCPWPDYWGVNNYNVDELSNDTVYDEVYYRNRKIENKYNIVISAIEVGNTDTCVESLQPLILSDSGAFDLICFAYSTGSYGLISSGLLTPWNDVPYMDYTLPWWNKSCSDTSTLNGKTYFNAGSFNWYGIAMCFALFFNENLRQELGIEDLYALVDNGEWTIDKLTELSRLASKDLDSNGRWTIKDRYGLGVFNPICGDVMALASGFEHVTNNGDGTFTINIGNEKHMAILEKVYDLYKKDNHIAMTNADCKMFSEGRALFFNDYIFDSVNFREMTDDFGILPMPKYNEAQEHYISYADSWSLANALPICTKPEDYEMIGAVINSLSVESLNKVYPAYYEYTLKGRDTRDTDSWRMLDIISSSLVYDFGIFFIQGGSDSNVFPFHVLLQYGREKKDLASYTAEHIDSWNEHYGNVMKFGLDDK